MAKLDKHPARAEKRARSKARRGGSPVRGSKPTTLTPVQLALMGKGPAASFTPYPAAHSPRGRGSDGGSDGG